MKVGFLKLAGVLGCCAAMTFASTARAADVNVAVTTQGKETVAQTWRCSQLEKMSVRNSAGDKIGSIEDLVINTASGKVAYAALGFGGFLGMGEKLFAVPWGELRIHHSNNEHYIVLNVTKEELKMAPGFEKNNWPDFADPNFTQKIDTYYREHRASDNKVGQR